MSDRWRDVADAALAMSIISGPTFATSTGSVSPAPDSPHRSENGVRGLRIAYSPRLGYVKRVDPEVEGSVKAAALLFESLGAGVETADPDIGGDPIAG